MEFGAWFLVLEPRDLVFRQVVSPSRPSGYLFQGSRLRFHGPFQNRHRGSVILRVAEAEVNACAAPLLEKFLSVVVQDDEWLARILAAHLHVLPTELFADAGAEGFGNRFLGRETRGEKWSGIVVREAIG